MKKKIRQIFEESIATKADFISNEENQSLIEKACKLILTSYAGGGKVLLMGNGGSAADAQHICAEFVGRFVLERKALPAVALTTDTSILTAVANDYGFDNIFARQISALTNKGDIIICLSTSGNSKNIELALIEAHKQGAVCIGILGKDGGNCKKLCDVAIVVNGSRTARIQETHITIGHVICEMVENELYGK